MSNTATGILVILMGLFCLAACFFNWNFFFNSRKAYWIVKIFGRTGARCFYALVGIAIVVLGTMGLLNIGN